MRTLRAAVHREGGPLGMMKGSERLHDTACRQSQQPTRQAVSADGGRPPLIRRPFALNRRWPSSHRRMGAHILSAAANLDNSQSPLIQGSVGVGFSGAGLLFPYYIGVVQTLQEEGIIGSNTKIAGSSAGSVIAVATACGLSMDLVTEGCRALLHDYRRWGTAGKMRQTVAGILNDLLPEDVHHRIHDKAFVSVTRILPLAGGELVSRFHSKADVVSSLLTSCHIPLYFDSHFETMFRQGLYMDGCVSDMLPSPPGCQDVVKVSAMPMSRAAGLFGHRWDIAPDRFNPFSAFGLPQSVVQALLPVSHSEFEDLIASGRSDAKKWVQRRISGRALISPPP